MNHEKWYICDYMSSLNVRGRGFHLRDLNSTRINLYLDDIRRSDFIIIFDDTIKKYKVLKCRTQCQPSDVNDKIKTYKYHYPISRLLLSVNKPLTRNGKWMIVT